MAFAKSYYGVRLSENLAESEPEKYLIFRNAVIARSGSQTYKGAELPQRTEETSKDEITAQDLGLGPDDEIDLYRPVEEVQHPTFIASLQGKPITDTHPNDLLNLDTVKEHFCGHLIDVRPGTEPLEDGNMPLLADGIIVDRELKEKILAGLRDLSLGYNYSLAKQGNRVLQVGYIGNHCAVVPNGRAGLAAIMDSAEKVLPKVELKKFREKIPMSKLKNMLLSLGLQAYAKDGKPEDVAEAIDELFLQPTSKTVAKDAHPEGCKCNDCMPKGKDALETKEVSEEKKEAEKGTGEDSAKMAKDAKRKKFHDALDKELDAKDAAESEKEKEKEAEAKDAENDLNELRNLFAAGNTVSKETPGLDEDETMAEDEEDDYKENEEARETEETAAADEDLDQASPIIEPINRDKPDVPKAVDKAALDAATQKGAIMILKQLRPVIAASKDVKVQKAFDSMAREINKSATKPKNGGSYKAFSAATVARDSKVPAEPEGNGGKSYTEVQLADMANAAYATASKEMATLPSRK